jgi:hypothetical protein
MDYKIGKEIVSYCLITSIFITGTAVGEISFSIYWFTPIYVLFLVYGIATYQKINAKVVYALAGLVLYSLLTFKSDVQLVIKQLVNISMFTLVFYYLIAQENYSLDSVFRKYVLVAKVILVIGYVQVLAFYLGFDEPFLRIFPFLKNTNISYRFQSLSEEPSFLGITFTPIVFLVLHNFFYGTRFLVTRTWGFFFVVGYLLTFASTCYLAFVFMLGLLYLKNFSLQKAMMFFAFASVVGVFIFFAYSQIDLIKTRVDDTAYAFGNDFHDPSVYRNVNLSTYAFMSNFSVTKEALREHPLAGRGLGTHEVSYFDYLPPDMTSYYMLNAKDANSMALRLLSETGLIGFFLFLWFAFHYYLNSKRSYDEMQQFMWVLNSGIAVVIFSMLLRHGNYTSSGKIFFLLLYYYSYRTVTVGRRKAKAKQFSADGSSAELAI